MTSDTKIAILIKNDLADWQKLNVAAFLASAVAIKCPETHGEAFINASNSTYLPFINQPILIYKAESIDEMNRAFKRAKYRALQIGIYTHPLFATKSEVENLKIIAEHIDDDQDLVGLVFYGDARKVNKALSGLKFHD